MSGDSCPNHVWTTTAATQSDDVDASLVDPCGNVCVDANGNPTGVDPCGLACTDACGNLCVDACLVDPCGNVCVDPCGVPSGVDPCGNPCTDACGELFGSLFLFFT